MMGIMVHDVGKPEGQAVNQYNAVFRWPPYQKLWHVNRFFNCFPLSAPLLAVPSDTFFHLGIKGLRSGDKKPSGPGFRNALRTDDTPAHFKGKGTLSAFCTAKYESMHGLIDL